ncbi:MAG: PilZ domain-containing protein [Deltaproteobacteria bacterium]|nr:PilZ domain-containing protein [Deltaproteobacteria bacterium]
MSEHRAHPRIDVAVRGELEHEGDTIAAETQNLSTGGVALKVRQAVPDGAVVTVQLFLTQDGFEDPDEAPLVTKAAVRWTAEGDGGGHVLGLQFAKLADAKRAQLDRFLSIVGKAAGAA